MLSNLLINHAYAVTVGVPVNGQTEFTWGSYVETIYAFSVKIGAVLVALMLIYAGYVYLTSQGESSKLNTAKDIFIGSLLGYVLLLLVGAILNYIGIEN